MKDRDSQTAPTPLAQIGPIEAAFAGGGQTDGHTKPISLVEERASRVTAARDVDTRAVGRLLDHVIGPR